MSADDVRALHVRESEPVSGQEVCGHCVRLCHSHSGLGCESPDAPWPCETIRALES